MGSGAIPKSTPVASDKKGGPTEYARQCGFGPVEGWFQAPSFEGDQHPTSPTEPQRPPRSASNTLSQQRRTMRPRLAPSATRMEFFIASGGADELQLATLMGISGTSVHGQHTNAPAAHRQQ
jgi:hypothetical protein